MIELIFSKLHPIPPTQLFCSQKKQQNKKTSNGLRIHASWRTPAQLADWRRRTWTWGAPQIIDQNQSIADRERVHTGTFRRGERRIVRTKRERETERAKRFCSRSFVLIFRSLLARVTVCVCVRCAHDGHWDKIKKDGIRHSQWHQLRVKECACVWYYLPLQEKQKKIVQAAAVS